MRILGIELMSFYKECIKCRKVKESNILIFYLLSTNYVEINIVKIRKNASVRVK